ncbi:MAG: chitobiase/beta-hexosaminidase C-terminal domain-containing protein, partial [Deltaproteobacteria bacterium]|nr:chitobiase/beta-hexosaminidase C-terminal domain-containing protein [Deltaproteobacteria bacterium]
MRLSALLGWFALLTVSGCGSEVVIAPADSGQPVASDTGAAHADASTVVPDATQPIFDAATPDLDAAVAAVDAATPELDAATPEADAAIPEPDASTPTPDASLETDAGADPCANNGGCDPLTTCTVTGSTRVCGACPSSYTGTGETGCVPCNHACPTLGPSCHADGVTLETCTADASGCRVLGSQTCAEGFCSPTSLVCATPTCSDGFKNAYETDVDCGGSCPTQCLDGLGCLAAADCASGFCSPTSLVCATPTCTDGFKNAYETDVDCGGSCPTQCPDGQACLVAGDCEHGFCGSGTCGLVFTIDPYQSPTNVSPLVLTGTKVAGAAIWVDGVERVPAGPSLTWQVSLTLVEGPNTFLLHAVLGGASSLPSPVNLVYDLQGPTITFTPGGGVFLNGLEVSVTASEPATVYLTRDGSVPNLYSEGFDTTRSLRVFDDTVLTASAVDRSGNWTAAPVSAAFEITSDGNAWRDGPALGSPLAFAGAAWDGVAGTGRVFVAGGTDGTSPTASAGLHSLSSGAWSALPA